MSVSTVHIVNCVDTEGPLYESRMATFERLQEILSITLEPTKDNLAKVQNKELDLNGKEDDAALIAEPRLLEHNDTWARVDEMLDEMMSPAYRNKLLDSFGGGWVYNWHCVDLVGFEDNPRRRDLGFHNIFDHFVQKVDDTDSHQDGIHFHHHPVPFNKSAHRCATHYFSHTPVIFEILARRILDRHWFPSVNRPGFHTARPDSHWLLEQYIPFDYANQASNSDWSGQTDLADGRFGDWRRAPRTWTPYHPDHDDYEKPGNCRRWIARCLNLGSRFRLITEADIEQAFQEAQSGAPVILCVVNHDHRDMRQDVDEFRAMLETVADRHPDVPFRFAEARDAMRQALNLPVEKPVNISLTLNGNKLHVEADKPIFGPQPFFALKTAEGRYFHDNLDFQEPFKRWTYVFDHETFPPAALELCGVGCCDSYGNATVSVMNLSDGTVIHKHH